jgi:hypothetical protein
MWESQLSTPWDLSTVSKVTTIVPSGSPLEVTGLFVRSDDSQIFLTNERDANIHQYDEASFDGTVYASVQKE